MTSPQTDTAVVRSRAPAADPRSRRGPRRPRRAGRGATVAVQLLLWGYALVAIGPLLLMLVYSVRPSSDIFSDPLGMPTGMYLGNYVEAWTEAEFGTYFLNSVLVTCAAVFLGTAVSALAAYPLGRYRFRGHGVLTAYFIAGLTLPIRLAAVPIFYLLASLGMIDSQIGLALVYAASGVPFSIFILTAFFRGLPDELEDASRIDGAGEFRIFGLVMLPLVRPALATVALFQFVQLWNDFFFPLILLRTTEKYTLPVGLTYFFGQYQTDWGAVFAGLVITTLPLVIVFLLLTRHIVAGLVAGMSK
ncbi:MAG: carbohydrate ABC transporter permease [Nocardioidaceae bacterium]